MFDFPCLSVAEEFYFYRQELTREKSRIEQQKLANDQEKELIKMKQQEIESMAMQVNQSTRDMDQMSVVSGPSTHNQ